MDNDTAPSWAPQARQAVPSAGDRGGVPTVDLSEDELLTELESVHRTRHDTFLHGSTTALVTHSDRQWELEDEYLRRHPERDIDPRRLRPDGWY